jgi:TolB-like protein
VGVAYAIVAWLLIQVSSAVFPQLQLPDWAPTLVTVLLLFGFPVALLLAWAFELTPDGIKRARSYAGAAAPSAGVRSLLDYVLIAGLAFVAAAILWRWFEPEPGGDGRSPSTDDGAPSIAVLPFADMSPDGDQEYFADGIAEELLNELMRLDGLRVAGRTSSFSYKTSDKSLREIGKELLVGTILEGSVRKDGDRIRITVQLVDTGDGYQLWSETFNRELKDIFTIQEEISAAVAGQLGVRLGVGGVNAFRGAGTRNVEAYEAYLQGVAIRAADFDSGIRLLDRAIALDPNYAAAWAARGLAGGATGWLDSPEKSPELIGRAIPFVEHALELDPDSAQAHALLGNMRYGRLDWIGGHESHSRALSLIEDRTTLNYHGNLLLRAGRLGAARVQHDAAEAVEPLGGRPADFGVYLSIAQGRFAEARARAAWLPADRATGTRSGHRDQRRRSAVLESRAGRSPFDFGCGGPSVRSGATRVRFA